MSELVQIVNQAQEFYNTHSEEIKLVGLTMVLATIPAYEAAKAVIKKVDNWLDKIDQEMTDEQKKAMMEQIHPYDISNPYQRLF